MNRLRELRENKNLTLKQLEKQINMNASVLGNYERGDRQPKIEVWETLADFFDVSVPYIMGLEELNENMITIPKTEYERLVAFEKGIMNQVNVYGKRGD